MDRGKVTRSRTLGNNKRKRDTYDISKQGITATKIELAAQAIVEENKRRKKFNAKRGRLEKDALPLLYPTGARIYTRPAYSAFGGVSGVMASNKYLCGRLSALCDALRSAGIAYPWRTVEG